MSSRFLIKNSPSTILMDGDSNVCRRNEMKDLMTDRRSTRNDTDQLSSRQLEVINAGHFAEV